ncbi:MAG: LysR family transcriptional regulator [Pseudomonadota bacterium]|nr:LysR family transcriptional regulator [Pseudomonadota bacterium]
MNANSQYRLNAADMEVVLALARVRTLAAAGERLGVDPSTVFRSIQRIERGLGQPLFERSRSGYLPSEQAQVLAGHAEQMEAHLESARSAAQMGPEQVSGTVRITTTDTILHGLVAPTLKELHATYPYLAYELSAGNELASLTRRDADIAVRATKRPPQHLVGKHVGPIRMALYAAKKGPVRRFDEEALASADWIAPDDALPEHPSVLWRRKHFPKVSPTYRVNSILTVMEFVVQGLGVALLPMFLAQERIDLRALTSAIDECQTELWLLAHPESRHLRRVSTVFGHLSQRMALA